MKKNVTNILIVDDEKDIRESLRDILLDEGHSILLAENASVAINLKAKEKIDLILLDIWMPDTDGISLLKQWAKNKEINCPVIMMSGHGTIDTAIEATKIGATDFLEKPISLNKLLKTVSESLKSSIVLDGLDKDFLDNSTFNYIQDFRQDLSRLKKFDFVCLVGKRGNFLDMCIKYLINTNVYNIESSDVINEKLVDSIESKGTKSILIKNFLKYSDEKKDLFISLIDQINYFKIKVLFIDEEINKKDLITLELIDKNLSKTILQIPDFIQDKDLIPDFAGAILDFYLDKNKNFGFKEFDISALNALRIEKEIMSIDILDKLVLNLIIHSDAEKITIHDVNGYFKSNVLSGESKNDFVALFDKPLRDARNDFERMYFDFHLQNKCSVADLAKKTGIERTHLYRKLKQLKIKV